MAEHWLNRETRCDEEGSADEYRLEAEVGLDRRDRIVPDAWDGGHEVVVEPGSHALGSHVENPSRLTLVLTGKWKQATLPQLDERLVNGLVHHGAALQGIQVYQQARSL